MLNKTQILCAAAMAAAVFSAGVISSSDAAEPDAAGVEFFEKHIRPLLVKHCYECHTAEEANGGLALDSRDGLLKGGDSGPALKAGQPDKSLLIEAVRYGNQDLQMPPQNRLPKADLELLERWVTMGAPDPREATESGGAAAPVGMSIDDGRAFWSFQPVSNPPIPTVTDADWVQSQIDAFVLAKLESTGLKPAPRADKRTLIRRVTFDLTGLPPTPQEIEDFLQDESPAAFRTLVERLLASPRYGERWGRHWLDVARYADSNGLDENLAFGNAWRYRDYVVSAFNTDKPFDQFLIEQLAGDLLPHATPETRTATGFLVLGAKVLAEPDREKLVMDTIDEQLDATGKAFLGMTLGCVRCHDHKFDPIKQTDYYALAGIFKSTRTFADSNTGAIKHWYEHSFATPEEKTRLAEVDKQIAQLKGAANSYKSAAMARIREEARAKAADYLVAAASFEPTASLGQVETIARPRGLHPRILLHCRKHLADHRDDAVFARWHELAAVQDIAGIEQHYRSLFAEVEAAWVDARKANPKATKLDDGRLEVVREALYRTTGFLAVPPKPGFAFDEATLAEYYRLAEAARVAESTAPDVTTAMGVSDGLVIQELPIHIRGSHRNLGQPVPRGFPEVMRAEGSEPILRVDQSGRLELARWMVDTQHPLTGRVYVNRVWRWHFGTGLVSSTENFGRLGDRPSHPELLDWLARRLMESGWSTKELHRQILVSSTYQMASKSSEEATASLSDPEDRLLWKFPLQRLEAEQIRDALLAVSGRIDEAMGGKSIPLRNRQFVFDHTSIDHTKYDSLRRSLYLPVVRNNLYTLFEQFDFPDPTMPTGHRNTTTVAPQALLLLNSELVMDSADVWADALLDRYADDGQRVRSAYQSAFGRLPTDPETARILTFVGDMAGVGQAPRDVVRQAWSLVCQSLFASNEFLYVR